MENAAPADSAVAGGTAGTAGTAAAGGSWRFLISPRWLGWHVLMVVSFWGMLWLGDWQLHRALAGNALSWAYTFEWPLFSGFAVVFWIKTIRDEFRIKRGELPGATYGEPEDLPFRVRAVQSGEGPAEEEDEELSAYNAYLARLNAEVKQHGRWHGLR